MAYKLGKLPHRHDDRTLKFSKYVTPALPPPPAEFAWLPMSEWQMLGNDVAGNCTIAEKLHAIMLWLAFNFIKYTPTTATAISIYTTITAQENNGQGYDPTTDANDNGCVMLDVLNYFRQTGADGYKIAAFASLNIKIFQELKSGVMLFGCVSVGINVPAYLQSLFSDNTQVWRVATAGQDTTSIGGHDILIVKYNDNAQLVSFISWGLIYEMEYALLSQICDEQYIMVSSQFFNKKGKTPLGYDFATMELDLTAVTSS